MESTEPRPVPIRSYVYILRENLLSTTGTGPWHTSVPYTLLTTISSSPSSPKLSSRVGSPELIPRSPTCFEKFMDISIAFYGNTEKLIKICVKIMVKSCENDVFTCLEIYLMLLIYYCKLLLHYLGSRFLSISLCFSNFQDYSSVMLIWIMLLAYIIMLILF